MRLPVADEKLDRVTQINQLMMVMTHVPTDPHYLLTTRKMRWAAGQFVAVHGS